MSVQPLRRKLWDQAATICIVAILLVLGVIGILSEQSTRRFLDNDAQVEQSHQALEAAERFMSDAKDIETGQRGYILTGQPEYLDPYESGLPAARHELSQLRTLIENDPSQHRRLETLQSLFVERVKVVDETIELYKTGHRTAATDKVRAGRGKFLMDQLRVVDRQIEDYARSRLRERTSRAELSGRRAQTVIIGGFGVALLLVMLALVFIYRYLSARTKAEEEARALYANLQDLNAGLERRVVERTARLTEANEELEAFSYSVSHDLRAPLRHISGFADLLRKRYDDKLDTVGKRYVDTIQEAGEHAGSLVDDLLSFSRMGRSEMRVAAVDMASQVADVRRTLAVEMEGRQIVWDVGTLLPIDGDPAMLHLVWQNLLSNAVKYTLKRETATIRVQSERKSDEIVYSVQDNGAGFDMRYVDKLFGVFQRLHAKEDFEGTGIGLANVRRIVQRHGGRTWAEGELDNGATFFFAMPVGASIPLRDGRRLSGNGIEANTVG